MATKFAGAIAVQQEEIKSLCSVLASIKNKLMKAPGTPTCRTRLRVEESDLETEVKTPPRRNKKLQQEKREEKKKKQQAAERAEQPIAARKTTSTKWKEGDIFKPGINWDDVPGNHKRAFIQARREFQRSCTAEAKAYKIEDLENMLKKAKDK